MTKTNLPATKGSQGTAVAAPIGGGFFEDFAGQGLENVTSSDMLVPRLTLIQSLSPQLNKKKPEYIEGAEIGDIADVGTGELFGKTILFLPVYYRKDYLEWAPRASGGGLVNIHSDPAIMDLTQRNDRNQPVLANGNLVQETAQFFGFNLSTPDRRRCFLPMASTQLKKARKWITLATSEKLKRSDGSEYVPPLFFRAYELGSAEESNAQGEWAGWTVSRGPALPELDLGVDWQTIGQDAIAFRDMLVRGDMKADVSSMQETEGQSEVM